MSALTFGSVCSGIEAASVAWHPLGWRAAWVAEIEAFPAAVLAHHYPDVPNLGDMTRIAAMVRAGLVAAPDVLVGGTPCQAFSVAGLRKSLDDARGQLSLSFVDLANAIDAARAVRGEPAATIVWENVPGVLSTKDNAFGCFLAALAGEDDAVVPPGKKWANAGCVFGPQRTVAWRVTDAQYFGVAQRRRRVFVVASARTDVDPVEVLLIEPGVQRHSAPSRKTGEDAAAGTPGGAGIGSHWDGAGYPHPTLNQSNSCSGVGLSNQELFSQRGAYLVRSAAVEPPGIDFRNMVSTGDLVHALQSGGHGVSPNNTPHVMSVALRGREGGATAELGGDLAGCLRASTGGGDKPHVLAPVLAFKPGQSEAAGGVFVTEDFAPTLQAQNNGSTAVPAVLAYAIQAGALRENPTSGPDGVGVQPDIAYTIEARAEVQAVAFRIHGENSIAMQGNGVANVADPVEVARCLDTSGGYATNQGGNVVLQAVAFSCKDHGADAGVEIAPTLRAMGYSGSHANGGGQIAVSYYPPELAPTLQAEGNNTGGVRAPGTTADSCTSLIAVSFKASHYTRGKDGAPSELTPPLSADADEGDQDTLILAPTIYTGDGVVADPTSANEGKTYTHEGTTARLHNCVGEPFAASFAENSRSELRLEGGDGAGTGALSTGGGKPGQGTPMVVTAFQERGRAGGPELDLSPELAYALLAPSGGSRSQERNVQVGMAVRRLTPRECERLQAFPDDYTLITHRGKPAADGPRYKALGNSMCVNNMRWIGERIEAVLATLAPAAATEDRPSAGLVLCDDTEMACV